MSHGTEHHLKEAEELEHHAHRPFDRIVALTMATLAALLAGITLLSHRGHTDTLRLQSEALALQAEAGINQNKANSFHVQASDQWSYFQAKKNRLYMYEAYADLVTALAKGQAPASEDSDPAAAKGKIADAAALAKGWRTKAAKYDAESNDIKTTAEGFEKQAEKYQKEAEAIQTNVQAKETASERVHHRTVFIDLGHLGLDIALVLCSIAVLARLRTMWLLGIVIGAIGVAVAASGFVLH